MILQGNVTFFEKALNAVEGDDVIIPPMIFIGSNFSLDEFYEGENYYHSYLFLDDGIEMCFENKKLVSFFFYISKLRDFKNCDIKKYITNLPNLLNRESINLQFGKPLRCSRNDNMWDVYKIGENKYINFTYNENCLVNLINIFYNTDF